MSLLEKNLGQLSVDRGIILKWRLKRMLSGSGCVSVNNIVKIVMTIQVSHSTENF
jgi:hypothetical protein